MHTCIAAFRHSCKHVCVCAAVGFSWYMLHQNSHQLSNLVVFSRSFCCLRKTYKTHRFSPAAAFHHACLQHFYMLAHTSVCMCVEQQSHGAMIVIRCYFYAFAGQSVSCFVVAILSWHVTSTTCGMWHVAIHCETNRMGKKLVGVLCREAVELENCWERTVWFLSILFFL